MIYVRNIEVKQVIVKQLIILCFAKGGEGLLIILIQ